jgi:pimeloyl-ACP methyl ester carboxylesterase
MTGALEPNSTPAMSEAMAALTPKGRAIIVPDAAHMMPMTHPEVVNAALLDFAAEVLS